MNKRELQKRRRLGFQGLETRQLMAADIDFDLVQEIRPLDDQLDPAEVKLIQFGKHEYLVAVKGTNAADDISINYQKGYDDVQHLQVGVNGEIHIPLSAIDHIDSIMGVAVWGLNGDDTITNRSDVTMYGWGHEGNDSLYGGSVADYLSGGLHRDQLVGNSGSDFSVGGSGNDTYRFHNATSGSDVETVVEKPAAGFDTFDFRKMTSGVSVNLATYATQTVSPHLQLDFETGNSIERVFGSDFSDDLQGNNLRNYLYGFKSEDSLEGGGNNDYLIGGTENDTYIFTGASQLANDVVIESSGSQNDGLDVLNFQGMTEVITVDLASNAWQTINSKLNLRLTSGLGIEGVIGTDADVASSEDDWIRGNSRNNLLAGMNGDDVLEGRGGDDVLNGGKHADRYVFAGSGDLGTDQLVENASGLDLKPYNQLDFSQLGYGIKFDMAMTSLQDVAANLKLSLNDPVRFNFVIGSEYDDVIFGNDTSNYIIGLGGNDELFGRGQTDYLVGGEGSDLLDGGADDVVDYLSGGPPIVFVDGEPALDDSEWGGADRFVDHADLVDDVFMDFDPDEDLIK